MAASIGIQVEGYEVLPFPDEFLAVVEPDNGDEHSYTPNQQREYARYIAQLCEDHPNHQILAMVPAHHILNSPLDEYFPRQTATESPLNLSLGVTPGVWSRSRYYETLYSQLVIQKDRTPLVVSDPAYMESGVYPNAARCFSRAVYTPRLAKVYLETKTPLLYRAHNLWQALVMWAISCWLRGDNYIEVIVISQNTYRKGRWIWKHVNRLKHCKRWSQIPTHLWGKTSAPSLRTTS